MRPCRRKLRSLHRRARLVQGDDRINHKPVNHSAKVYVDGMAHTNGIKSVWVVLKRGFYGIYHYFSVKHRQRYLEEFAFRLNEGSYSIHSYDHMDALLGKSSGVRLTYQELTA